MREFYEFAADHHGVFTRSEALERGVTASRLASMLRRGEVVRTYPSTYRLAGSSRTWDSKLRGAVASTEGSPAIERPLRFGK